MENRQNYKLSALAKKDLLAIFNLTIQKWGESKAREYAQKLSNGLDLLSQSPEIGKSRNELYPNALSFPVGSHIIFYAINNELNTNIEIARVLHQHMDFEKQFVN